MTLTDFENKMKDIWDNHRWLFIVVAIPLLVLKFRSLIIDLLVKDSRQITDDTVKKDTVLKEQETKENTQADQVIADANKARKDADNQTVDENWNKK